MAEQMPKTDLPWYKGNMSSDFHTQIVEKTFFSLFIPLQPVRDP